METCPKCGKIGGISTRYCNGYIDCEDKTRSQMHGVPEHLDKVCSRCCYGWSIPCKDAKP